MSLRNTYPFILLLSLSIPLRRFLETEAPQSYDASLRESSLTALQNNNHSPTVRIMEPTENSVHPRNAMIRYSISVSDPEDGESKYDEIPADRIFLRISYFEGKPAPKHVTPHSGETKATAGFRIVQHADCFNCHQFKSKSIGPSFTDIGRQYTTDSNTSATMADKIVSGSQGKWGTEIMPAHPDLSTYEAQLISEWILSASHDDSVDYLRGKEGTVKLEVPEHAGAGYFVMTAIYTDAGVQGKNKSSDVESIIIRLR